MVDYGWLEDEGVHDGFCLTFVRGGNAEEVLRRFGVDPATIEPAEGVVDNDITAGLVGDWVFVFEDNGYEGCRPEVLRAVSLGTEAVSVYTNVNGDASFCRAIDGVPEDLALDDDGVDGALIRAAHLTGVYLDHARASGQVLTGELIALLPDPALGPSFSLRTNSAAMALIESGDPAAIRQAVTAHARQLAVTAGVADFPAVAAALAAAEAGETQIVSDQSELGLLVRQWGCYGYNERRVEVFRRYAAGLAVRAALFPDVRRAAYEVLDK